MKDITGCGNCLADMAGCAFCVADRMCCAMCCAGRLVVFGFIYSFHAQILTVMIHVSMEQTVWKIITSCDEHTISQIVVRNEKLLNIATSCGDE